MHVNADATVTVRFFAAARAAAGCDEIAVEPASLEVILERLAGDIPGLNAVLPRCSFLVDALAAKAPFDAPVAAGSTVDVLPPFAGG